MTWPAPGGPTVLRIILGRQLQALREKAGLSHEQAAKAVYASAWTIRRMEKAEIGLKLNYVKSLRWPERAMSGTGHRARMRSAGRSGSPAPSTTTS